MVAELSRRLMLKALGAALVVAEPAVEALASETAASAMIDAPPDWEVDDLFHAPPLDEVATAAVRLLDAEREREFARTQGDYLKATFDSLRSVSQVNKVRFMLAARAESSETLHALDRAITWIQSGGGK